MLCSGDISIIYFFFFCIKYGSFVRCTLPFLLRLCYVIYVCIINFYFTILTFRHIPAVIARCPILSQLKHFSFLKLFLLVMELNVGCSYLFCIRICLYVFEVYISFLKLNFQGEYIVLNLHNLFPLKHFGVFFHALLSAFLMSLTGRFCFEISSVQSGEYFDR